MAGDEMQPAPGEADADGGALNNGLRRSMPGANRVAQPPASRDSIASSPRPRQVSATYSPGPLPVTARMVDPSAPAPADDFGAGPAHVLAGASRSSLASASTDYSPGPARHHHSSYSRQQPTLAALALADSRGQLDSGLGYYYHQQPHRMRADLRAGQGFYSEPVSSAGSPAATASSPDSYAPRMRSAGSMDQTVGAMTPGASALGVVFPPTVSSAKTMVDAAGQRASGASSSSRLNSRDSSDPCGGGELSAHTTLSHNGPLAALPESESLPGDGGSISGRSDGSRNNGAGQHLRRHHQHHYPQRMAQHSAEFAPPPSHTTTPSASAASLTAASGSFSFQNGLPRAQSHHQGSLSIASHPSIHPHPPQPPPRPAPSASASANRDSMFLRFKEKMRYFKPRARPQSDNLTDRRDVPGAPPAFAAQQMGSPQHGPRAAGPEPVLFGLPLARAVVLAGVCVGRVASSGEDCVVPTVVAACGRHLWDRGQQTQGIFRVNGSMKRVQRLQAEFNTGPAYGRSVQWGGYTLHDAATMLRRYLTSLPESVIGSEHYSAFMDQLAATLPDEAKARAYGALIDQRLVPASRHTLLYMLELLSGFARPDNSARTLMNAANLAAVLQPCLLVHPGHIANPHEYTRAKDVVEFLIVHAAAMYAPRNGEPPAARLVMMDASPSASPATTDRMRAMTCGEQSVSGDCDHAAATNDDGATLDAYSNGPPSPHHHTRPTQWAQAPAHDSMSAAPYSPGPATMHGGAERMSAVPPNGTSAFRDNLAPNDGPRDAMHAADAAPMALSAPPQPLGSVTARLFDPAVAAGEPSSANGRLPLRPRMDTYDSWHAGQSGLAVNSIQYEHTATTAVRRPNRASLLAEPDSPVDVRSPTRPRRSMSFVVSSPTSDRQAIVSDHTGDSDGEQPTDDDDNDGYGDGRVDMDAFTHDIMSRSSNAARARRHAGERRAGHVNIHTPYTADTAQQGQKPLPPIPRPVGSGPSDDALRPTSASKLRRVGPFAGVAPEPTAAGFALYPRAQPTAAPAGSGADHPRAYAQVPATGPPHRMYRQSGTFAPGPVPDQDRPSKYGGAPASASQAWAAAPDAANGTRALWLSEDAPEDDYEFVGGRQPLWTQGAHSSESELHRYPAAASASTSAMGSGPPHGMADTQQQQQQPRHVFAGAHPDAVPIHRQGRSLTTGAMGNHEVAASQLNRHKVLHPAAATDSGKDKASMTRLKSLFRMGGVTTATGSSSNSSSSGGVGGSDSGNSKDPKKARVPVPGPLAVSNARADAAGQFSKTISSPRFTAKGFQQPSALGGLPRDAMPAGGSFEMASRLQVTVPAGHLSIVYPDSPMSKADTLRRSSDESYTNRMSAGIAAGSGRAYLVNPDDDADGADADIEPLSENGGQRFRGADLHSAPSNTTTLGPSSQLRQHPPPRVGMQDSYATLGGGSMSASGVGYMSSTTTFLTSRARDANVSGHDAGGNGSSGKPRLYAMHRLADSDTQIAQHHPHLSRSARGPSDADAFVLPSIGSGSPLMPAFGFDGRDFGSPPQQQARPYDAGREHRLAQQLLPSADDGDGDDGAGGSASAANSPRRSRSLRNTITSLRRKLSRSSRSSADVTPASLDDHAPTASVH